VTTSFTYLFDLVRQQTGVDLGDDKSYLADSRLYAIAQQEKFNTVADLVFHLSKTILGPLHYAVVQAMLTHETFFFRDQSVYDALRFSVLPQVIRDRASTQTLRFWSAACSTGQEAFSLALLLQEHFPELASWDIKIYASDINLPVLNRAREGLYTDMEVSRGLPEMLRQKHFLLKQSGWQATSSLMQMIECFPLNLAAPKWPQLPTMDLVLLRNVMIYFNQNTRSALLSRVSHLLDPTSFLILGNAERVAPTNHLFEPCYFDRALFYRLRKHPSPWHEKCLSGSYNI
jgi:chemotaxis protein methyltransferase CheR